MRLRRVGFNNEGIFKEYNPGHLASYLCFLFLEKSGIVCIEDLYKYKVFKNKKNIDKFLLILSKNNFIEWDTNLNLYNKYNKYQTFLGSSLKDLITIEQNQEKEVVKTLKQENLRLNRIIASQQDELNSFKKVVHDIINSLNKLILK